MKRGSKYIKSQSQATSAKPKANQTTTTVAYNIDSCPMAQQPTISRGHQIWSVITNIMPSRAEQSDVLTYFGISENCKRSFRRNVWSASEEEESHWVQNLLSVSNQRNSPVVDTSLANGGGASNNIGCSDIPRMIHFIWLGEKSMPKFPFLQSEIDDYNGQKVLEWNECVESWKMHHPLSQGWDIIVWTEEDIVRDNHDGDEDNTTNKSHLVLKHSEMRNIKAYQQAVKTKNYGSASDILRLEILRKFGGVYVDIDYFCVGCLHDVVSRQAQFFCGASNTGCVELNNGLMGCRKGGHQIVTTMIDSIHDYYENYVSKDTKQDNAISLLTSFLDASSLNALEESDSLSPMDVIEYTGPGLLTRTVCRWLVANGDKEPTKSSIVVLPSSVLHPFPNHLRSNIAIDDEKNAKNLLFTFLSAKETKAVHLWGCSWQNEK